MKSLEMNLKFHSSDFVSIFQDELSQVRAAERANQVLEEHLKTLPIVYSVGLTKYGGWSQNQEARDKFRAVLFGIEEMK